MKDEIKEILDKLRSDDYYEKEYQKSIYYERDLKKLEESITNLQEENEILKDCYRKHYFKYKNKVYDGRIILKQREDYKSRIEKIIRKISLYRMDDITMESNRILNDLLNVALGEDKDVKD